MQDTLKRTTARERDLIKECSLRHPLYLQLYPSINAVRDFFSSLPSDKELIICDFGCGQKPYKDFVAKIHKYIGIDIDLANTEADIYADIHNVPLEDNFADVCVSFFVLEHVSDPIKVLQEKFRILKPNGLMFMLVPLYWEEHEQPFDYFRFTRFGLKHMLGKAGFKSYEIMEVNASYSILGMHIVRYIVPKFGPIQGLVTAIINHVFHKLDAIYIKKCRVAGKEISNVMTFAVKAVK